MYRKINDFINDWKVESDSTLKIFSKLNEENLLIKPNENLRSLGRLAWHITQTLTEMPHKVNLIDDDELEHLDVPTLTEIIDLYKQKSIILENAILNKWNDNELEELIEIYGQKWEKRKVLSVLINHQIHHRAQMTVIMRFFNIEVPGIYGPSKEEWSNFGMNSQE